MSDDTINVDPRLEQAKNLKSLYDNREGWLGLLAPLIVTAVMIVVPVIVFSISDRFKDVDITPILIIVGCLSVGIFGFLVYIITGFVAHQSAIKKLGGSTQVFNKVNDKGLESNAFYHGENEPLIVEYKTQLEALKEKSS